MNNPPFYVGQRVVAIEDSNPLFNYAYKKGQEEVVAEVRFNKTYNLNQYDFRSEESLYCWMDCRKWRPIERQRIVYVSVAEEIKEKSKEHILETAITN